MSKFNSLKVSASAALLALSLGFALPAIAQDSTDEPATTDQAAPPADDSDSAAPADEGTPDQADPGDSDSAAPGDEAPSDEAPTDSDGEKMNAPGGATAPEKSAEAPAQASPMASDLALNAPVISSDGKNVGTVARISAAADGSVAQIYVNTGSSAVVVPGSAIAESGPHVKLSLPSADVAKLPAPDSDNDNG
jgi:hypothetical protein